MRPDTAISSRRRSGHDPDSGGRADSKNDDDHDQIAAKQRDTHASMLASLPACGITHNG
jgi:hypothetical protein